MLINSWGSEALSEEKLTTDDFALICKTMGHLGQYVNFRSP